MLLQDLTPVLRYLENVLLGETSSDFKKARAMLPPVLSQAMAELEAHFERLANVQQRTLRSSGTRLRRAP